MNPDSVALTKVCTDLAPESKGRIFDPVSGEIRAQPAGYIPAGWILIDDVNRPVFDEIGLYIGYTRHHYDGPDEDYNIIRFIPVLPSGEAAAVRAVYGPEGLFPETPLEISVRNARESLLRLDQALNNCSALLDEAMQVLQE